MDELLSCILNNERSSIPELCARLHTSKDMLLARLEMYERLGYVKRVVESSDGCSGSCSGCSGCGENKLSLVPGVYWIKGERIS